MKIEQTGWLLDLYEDPGGGVVVWFLGDDGQRRLLSQRLAVTFYAATPKPGNTERLTALQVWLAGFAELARTRMTTRQAVFSGNDVPVLAVDVKHAGDLSALFYQTNQRFPDLTYADVDLQLSLRYAATTGVSLLGRCQIIFDEYAVIQSITPLDSPWDLDPPDVPLRVMTLAPDSDPAHGTPRSLRVSYERHNHTFGLTPVRPLLVNLYALLKTYDPDLLLTAWGDTWLLPHLLALAETHNLPLPLNRDRYASVSRREERWYYSYGQIVYRGEQVQLFGRWHVDRHNAMMWSDYELDGLLEMTRVTGLPLQTAARVSPGTGISAIQMLTALRKGVLVPWQKQQVEMLKPAAELYAADQGGLVYQPMVGVHRNVAEIDFISLYPAIMVYNNISPETIGRDDQNSETVPTLEITIDRSREGLVPAALRPLLEKRVALKLRQSTLPTWDPRRTRDKRRASALKWLLVTCFGYLGYKNARFGRIEAHQAVTAYGREALLCAKETAEAHGCEVLQMYVDGLWIQQPGKSKPEDYTDLLKEIQANSGLPIALDGIYRWLVFLPSRQNLNRPVANRYFGVFQSGEIKARGIATRRRDTPPWIAQIQMKLLELLARAPEPEQALPETVTYLRRCLADLRIGRVKLEDLLVTQRVSREVADYRALSPAGRAVKQLSEAGKVIKPGQRIRFLYTLGKPGVFAWNLPEPPNPAWVNVPRYRDLLLRAAGEVLAPFGASEDRLRVSMG